MQMGHVRSPWSVVSRVRTEATGIIARQPNARTRTECNKVPQTIRRRASNYGLLTAFRLSQGVKLAEDVVLQFLEPIFGIGH